MARVGFSAEHPRVMVVVISDQSDFQMLISSRKYRCLRSFRRAEARHSIGSGGRSVVGGALHRVTHPSAHFAERAAAKAVQSPAGSARGRVSADHATAQWAQPACTEAIQMSSLASRVATPAALRGSDRRRGTSNRHPYVVVKARRGVSVRHPRSIARPAPARSLTSHFSSHLVFPPRSRSAQPSPRVAAVDLPADHRPRRSTPHSSP